MAEQGFQQSQKIEKIERVERIEAQVPNVEELAGSEEISASTKAKFDEAVAQVNTKWDQAAIASPEKNLLVAVEEPPTKLSPIQEMSMSSHKIERLQPITVGQVVQQAEDAKGKTSEAISKVQDALNQQPNFQLNPAQDAIMTDKLIHVESHLKTALAKVGVEATGENISGGQKPLVKFLNYLTNSDNQLNTLIGQLNGLQGTGAGIQPSQLLALQIKLGFVQTQIEFFTNVLNKAVEGTKTIMNVQV